MNCPPNSKTNKILITTWGSRGDIQPLLGLAEGLRNAGYYIAVQANNYAKDIIEYYGFPFYSLSGEPEKILSSPHFKASIETNDITKVKESSEWQEAHMKIPQEILDIAQNFDMLLAHSLIFQQAYLVYKRLKIPLIGIALCPQFPTKKFKSSIVFDDHFSFDAVKNLESWEDLAKNRQHCAEKIYDIYRAEWNLSKIESHLGWLGDFWYKDKIPIISAFSPQIIGGQPDDWPEYVKCVGYFDLPSSNQLKLESFIDDWLNKDPGSKPILMTFGSMSIVEPNYMLKLANALIKNIGARVILSSEHNKTESHDPFISERLLIIKGAPFNILLPRCQAIVHHGGAGTTGTALKAGIPQVIIDFFADQPFWGNCVNKIGVGPRPLPYRSLREDDLIDSVKYALSDKVMERAEEIAESVRLESGVEEAVKVVEKVFEMNQRRVREKVKFVEVRPMDINTMNVLGYPELKQ